MIYFWISFVALELLMSPTKVIHEYTSLKRRNPKICSDIPGSEKRKTRASMVSATFSTIKINIFTYTYTLQ